MVASGRNATRAGLLLRWSSGLRVAEGERVPEVSEAALHRCSGVSMGCQFDPVAVNVTVKHKKTPQISPRASKFDCSME